MVLRAEDPGLSRADSSLCWSVLAQLPSTPHRCHLTSSSQLSPFLILGSQASARYASPVSSPMCLLKAPLLKLEVRGWAPTPSPQTGGCAGHPWGRNPPLTPLHSPPSFTGEQTPCPETPFEKPLLVGLGPILGAQEHWLLLTGLPAQSRQTCLTLRSEGL